MNGLWTRSGNVELECGRSAASQAQQGHLRIPSMWGWGCVWEGTDGRRRTDRPCPFCPIACASDSRVPGMATGPAGNTDTGPALSGRETGARVAEGSGVSHHCLDGEQAGSTGMGSRARKDLGSDPCHVRCWVSEGPRVAQGPGPGDWPVTWLSVQ